MVGVADLRRVVFKEAKIVPGIIDCLPLTSGEGVPIVQGVFQSISDCFVIRLRFCFAGLSGPTRPLHCYKAFASRRFVSLGPEFDDFPFRLWGLLCASIAQVVQRSS
jgi:hypothetical protein